MIFFSWKFFGRLTICQFYGVVGILQAADMPHFGLVWLAFAPVACLAGLPRHINDFAVAFTADEQPFYGIFSTGPTNSEWKRALRLLSWVKF